MVPSVSTASLQATQETESDDPMCPCSPAPGPVPGPVPGTKQILTKHCDSGCFIEQGDLLSPGSCPDGFEE